MGSVYRVRKKGATVRAGVELSSVKLGRLKARNLCRVGCVTTSIDGVERAQVFSVSKEDSIPIKLRGGWVSLWVLRDIDEGFCDDGGVRQDGGVEGIDSASRSMNTLGCAGAWQEGTVCECGGYELRSDFCGGNLGAARLAFDDALEARPAKDCRGEPWQSKHSAWFHFRVRRLEHGYSSIQIRCLSPCRQAALYRHGYRPVYRRITTTGVSNWERLPESTFSYQEVDITDDEDEWQTKSQDDFEKVFLGPVRNLAEDSLLDPALESENEDDDEDDLFHDLIEGGEENDFLDEIEYDDDIVLAQPTALDTTIKDAASTSKKTPSKKKNKKKILDRAWAKIHSKGTSSKKKKNRKKTVPTTSLSKKKSIPSKTSHKSKMTELTWKWSFEAVGDLFEFAFCYPYSYAELEARLSELEDNAASNNDIFFKREFLTTSVDGRRIELLTVTDAVHAPLVRDEASLELVSNFSRDGTRRRVLATSILSESTGGISWTVDSAIDDGDLSAGDSTGSESDYFDARSSTRKPPTRTPFRLTPDRKASHSHEYVGPPEIVVSGRVHPGETPSSFVVDGLLEFLLNSEEGRELRQRFIWRIIPMLNPDGVSRGHFRRDARGEDLNRRYWPDLDGSKHPSCAALIALVESLCPRVFAVIDCHAHATKRGCFIFGNYGTTPTERADAQLLATLLAARSPAFEFEGSDFSRRKMTAVPGSARVALKSYGLCDQPGTWKNLCSEDSRPWVHYTFDTGCGDEVSEDEEIKNVNLVTKEERKCKTSTTDWRWTPRAYTLECNYNMGHILDPDYLQDQPPHSLRAKLASDSMPNTMRQPYTTETWKQIGQSLALSMLDLARADDPFSLTPEFIQDQISWLAKRNLVSSRQRIKQDAFAHKTKASSKPLRRKASSSSKAQGTTATKKKKKRSPAPSHDFIEDKCHPTAPSAILDDREAAVVAESDDDTVLLSFSHAPLRTVSVATAVASEDIQSLYDDDDDDDEFYDDDVDDDTSWGSSRDEDELDDYRGDAIVEI